MALSEERRAARVFMLRHAAGWLMDLESTEICDDANGNWDPVKVAESKALAKRLEAMAAKLEAKR
ncbi:TPA: hypothetical protein QHB43_004602 [Aeromonas hydrophila subsp. hydrophila]|nr:hypothetical protein [Aeromonas hydrophila subsp. hydrophila]